MIGTLLFGAFIGALGLAAIIGDYRNAKANQYRSYLKRDWRDEPIRLTRWR